MDFYLKKMQKEPPKTIISLINVNKTVFFNCYGGIFGFYIYLCIRKTKEMVP